MLRSWIAALATIGCSPLATTVEQGWRPMFNGRDLTGWQTYLGGRGPKRPLGEAVGVDRDPRGVFQVVTLDGAPAVRISGELWGALTTREEHADYHFRVEWRWGQKRWAPRDQAPMDSGICYHSVGPYGVGSLVWMQSIEAQIMEGDSGSFYSVGNTLVDVEAAPLVAGDPATLVWKPGAPRMVGTRRRIARAVDAERPKGQWNVSEVLVVADASIHVVNGTSVMRLRGLRGPVDGAVVPLTKGRIQLQSEGAEIFFRNPEIRPLAALPDEAPSASASGPR
jgi:hypothetical protein